MSTRIRRSSPARSNQRIVSQIGRNHIYGMRDWNAGNGSSRTLFNRIELSRLRVGFANCELMEYTSYAITGWTDMTNAPLVEFVIRSSDLRKATKLLSLTRGEFKETDCADLLVSSFAATFRSVGTTTEVPIEGTHPGTVRLPLRILVKIIGVAQTYKARELKWQFEEGVARVEKFSLKNQDISLGILPDLKFDLPADAGPIPTLAMAYLLSPEQIANQGWCDRFETAQRRVREAVSTAVLSLQELGISREQIQKLVDIHIQETAEELKPAVSGRQ